MSQETPSIRVVRAVHLAASGDAPRWMTGTDVADACPEDKGEIVYATLSYLSKDETKGPLRKRRNQERGGVYEYAPIEGFDFDQWLEKRAAPRSAPAVAPTRAASPPPERSAPAPRPRPIPSAQLGNPKVQIVQVLIAAKRRLPADEIFNAGRFTSMDALKIWLADLLKPGTGVLERDRDEVGKPWRFGVRRDVDIDAWLRAQGAGAEVKGLTEYNARELKTATPPAVLAAAPSKEGAEPARAAATKTAEPPPGQRASAPQADAGSANSAVPKAAAPQAGTPVEKPLAERNRAGSAGTSAAAAAPVQQPAGVSGGGKESPAAPAQGDSAARTPAGPAEPKRRDQLELMTELTIVAAANLAGRRARMRPRTRRARAAHLRPRRQAARRDQGGGAGVSLVNVLLPADPPPVKRAKTVRPLGWDDLAERGRVTRKRRGRRTGQAHHRAKRNDACVARVRELREKDPTLWTLEALADIFKLPLATIRDWCDYSVRPL